MIRSRRLPLLAATLLCSTARPPHRRLHGPRRRQRRARGHREVRADAAAAGGLAQIQRCSTSAPRDGRPRRTARGSSSPGRSPARRRSGASTVPTASRCSSPAARTGRPWPASRPTAGPSFVQRDRKGEENPGLYVMSRPRAARSPRSSTCRTSRRSSSSSPRTGSAVYFHANDVKPDAYAIYRYDLAARRKELVFDEPGLWSVADHRPDGRLLLRKATGSLSAEYSE